MVTWKSIYARSQADAAHLAHLVDHVEDTRFDEILLGILQDKGPAAEVNGFLYASSNRDPRPVAWCGRPRGTAERVDRYARRYHQLDPTLHSLPAANRAGLTLVNVLKANRIGDATYRRTCFEKPAFSQKISVAQADAGGEWAIVNMYLGQQGIGEHIVQQLAAFGTLVVPFLRLRSRISGFAGPSGATEHVDERIGRKLRRRFPTLTERETRVCALTMLGKTSGEIATTLGIRPGTVITYRRRAYERLGVGNAASLLGEIL
ncbi:MAG TPA: helix-turn-helix transcriptional regulator [Sphingomonadaceae bacterium]